MFRVLLLSVFAVGFYSTGAMAMRCLPGDKEISSEFKVEDGTCTVMNYCTMYDFDPRWNYDQTYFNVHNKCLGTRQRRVEVITCERKDNQPVLYTAYNDGEWTKCRRGSSAYDTH